jgi:RHS repeat-associated protein
MHGLDRFGNRWQQNGPNSFLATFTGNNPGNPQNNNRMDGYSYDAAGNVLNDGTHGYTFDAENRIISVDNGATATYVYDSDGHRVQKTSTTGNPSDPAGTWIYFYDQAGRWVQKFTSPGNTFVEGNIYAGGRHLASVGGGTNFSHSDWLGTERLRTSYAGATCESIASLPFGDGLTTTGACYHPSPLHFTGKERDAESGLDNFGARYNSSSMGRFMSSDPGNAGLVNADPQSWNAYAYVRNNPVNLTDPTGAVFCRPANDAEKGQGVSQVCDVTDAEYVNSSKADQAAYDKAGYTHYDCSCDTNADKAAWAERKGNVSNDYVGDALVFLGALAIVRGLDPGAASPSDPRLPQDRKRQDDYPEPPDANNGNSTIGTNPNQDAALRWDIEQARQEGATDIRVNQEQTNAQGVRVGQNRPDLQYTDRNGIRHYIEYDQDPVNGAAHAQRIRANDPAGVVTPKTVK